MNSKSPHRPRTRYLLALPLLALLAVGCATAPTVRAPAVFYPSAPELPRVQFLTSFSGRNDVESQSGFNRFVVGAQTDVKLDKPYGAAIYQGKLYVCDTNTTVVVFDLDKHTFGILAGASGQGQLVAPVNISIEADGTKYVADPARGQVVVFGRDDQYVRAYGTPGNWRPVDAVPFGDRLYVVDGANAVVIVFDKASGEQVKTIGQQGPPEERLGRPTNLAFDHAGHLYVSDVGRFQVVEYDRDGHYQGTVGKAGDNLGHFARPKGIAIDRHDHLLAVDASFNNVQMFDSQGRLLMFFGAPGEGPGQLQLPAKVTLDYDNLKYFRQLAAPGFELEYVAIVTSQFGQRLVNVFGYGQEKGKRYPTEEEAQKQIEEKRRQARERLQQNAPPATGTPAPATAPAPTPPVPATTPAPTTDSAPAPAPTPTAPPPPPPSPSPSPSR